MLRQGGRRCSGSDDCCQIDGEYERSCSIDLCHNKSYHKLLRVVEAKVKYLRRRLFLFELSLPTCVAFDPQNVC